MSPRRNRRDRSGEDGEDDRPLGGGLPAPAPPGWKAVTITRERALKNYVCPGCGGAIPAGTPHVAAWRLGEDEHRRHWHRSCWDRERPRFA
ncbi:MAG: ATP/GTP-binding protein [Actinomycetota bacterium]